MLPLHSDDLQGGEVMLWADLGLVMDGVLSVEDSWDYLLNADFL